MPRGMLSLKISSFFLYENLLSETENFLPMNVDFQGGY